MAPPLVCVSLASDTGAHLVHVSEARGVVEDLLTHALVGHNVAYDMSVLAAQWPDLLPAIFEAYEQDRVTDTRLRDKLQHLAIGQHYGLGPDGRKIGYTLADCAYRRLGITLEKDKWRLRFGELIDVPLTFWPEDARRYAILDAQATYGVWQDQEADAELLNDQYRQARAAFWIQLMRCWGLRTDSARVAQFRTRVEADFEASAVTLREAGVVRPNGSRNLSLVRMRIAAEFEDAAPRTAPTERYPAGQIQTDKDVCKRAKDHVLRAFADYSHHMHELTNDCALLEQGLLQPYWESLKDNGRTGSGHKDEGTGNIQNMSTKNGMRECCVPRPGWVFLVGDYATFEMRTWAQTCKDLLGHSRLATVLNDGGDPHCEIASKILNLPYADVVARNAAKDPLVYGARQAGKVANFGFPGGLGAGRLIVHARRQYDVELTEQEALNLKAHWKESWPEAEDYFAYINAVYEGRIEQLRSHRYRAGQTFCECCNTFFSGLAADAAKAAGWALAREQYVREDSILFGTRTVNFVHDEFVVECLDDGRAPEAAEVLGRVMVDTAQPWLPDVRVEVEVLLARQWSKQAKVLRGQDGKLIAWEDE